MFVFRRRYSVGQVRCSSSSRSLTFIERIHRAGSVNDDMRSFVQTFRAQLIDAGGSGDDETVWRLLRRLQILTFDFTAPGSASEELAKERAAGALHSGEVERASSLWASLIELAESTCFDDHFVDQTSADTLAPALGNYINGCQLAMSTLGKALGSRHGLFAV